MLVLKGVDQARPSPRVQAQPGGLCLGGRSWRRPCSSGSTLLRGQLPSSWSPGRTSASWVGTIKQSGRGPWTPRTRGSTSRHHGWAWHPVGVEGGRWGQAGPSAPSQASGAPHARGPGVRTPSPMQRGPHVTAFSAPSPPAPSPSTLPPREIGSETETGEGAPAPGLVISPPWFPSGSHSRDSSAQGGGSSLASWAARARRDQAHTAAPGAPAYLLRLLRTQPPVAPGPAAGAPSSCSSLAEGSVGSRVPRPAPGAGPAHVAQRGALCVRAPRVRRERPGAERTRPVDSFPPVPAVTADTGPPGLWSWAVPVDRGGPWSRGTSFRPTHLRGGLGSRRAWQPCWTARRTSSSAGPSAPPAVLTAAAPPRTEKQSYRESRHSARGTRTAGPGGGGQRDHIGADRHPPEPPLGPSKAAAAAPTHRPSLLGSQRAGPAEPGRCQDEFGSRAAPTEEPLQPRAPAGAALAQLVAAEVGARGHPGTPGARGHGVCRPAKPRLDHRCGRSWRPGAA